MKDARANNGRVRGYRTSEDSDAVRRVRAALELTQEDFARELGCSTSTVAKMEKERRTPGTRALKDNLTRLAKKAGVNVSTTATTISPDKST